jgi:hypothetical protein
VKLIDFDCFAFTDVVIVGKAYVVVVGGGGWLVSLRRRNSMDMMMWMKRSMLSCPLDSAEKIEFRK